MILLVSKFHKTMFDKQGPQKIFTKFDNFQSSLLKVVYWKDLNLYKHLILLLKMLLSLNGNMISMKETTFAEILQFCHLQRCRNCIWRSLDVNTNRNLKFSFSKIDKAKIAYIIYDLKISDNCLYCLYFTIIVNFISNPNENS